jgi:hypothetical protein
MYIAITFTYEKSIYFNTQPDNIHEFLIKISIARDNLNAFYGPWSS